MAKYGISREFDPKRKKGGIFLYLVFFLLGLVGLSLFSNAELVKKYIPLELKIFSNKLNSEMLAGKLDQSLESMDISTGKNQSAADDIGGEIDNGNGEDKLESKITMPELDISYEENSPEPGALEIITIKDHNIISNTENPAKVIVYGNIENLPLKGFTVNSALGIDQQVKIGHMSGSVKINVTLPDGENIELMSDSAEAALARILSTGVDRRQTMVMDKIYFFHNSARLRQGLSQIVNLAQILKAYPEVKIMVRGHTDNVGDARYNKLLSAKRALRVKKILAKNGVANNRINTEGMGEAEPLLANTSLANRSKNRRVDISIYK